MTPAARRRLKRLAIAGVLVLGVWGAMQWRASARLQAAVESVGYYRVRASYTVKATGERVDFDYVAACAVVQTNYRDGDRSVDTPFGIAPKSFIAPTRDGHAIQVVTPEACHDEVKDGFIPPDLIPLTIFHDDVMKLGFGWGHKSQDAYDNARAQISFEGASVTAATYADRLAWEAKAIADYKPFGRILRPLGFSEYTYGGGREVSSGCRYYVCVPVFAEGRPALTAEWERRGRPEFWIVGDGMRTPEFWTAFRSQHVMSEDPVPRTKGGGIGSIQNYSSQRWGKEHYGRDELYSSNEVYPYLPISLSSTPPPGLDASVFPTKVPVSDDWKGLAACDENDPVIDDLFWGGRYLRSHGNINLDRGAGEPIGDRTRPFMVNDTVIADVRFSDPPHLFFQRDEFVLTYQSGPNENILR